MQLVDVKFPVLQPDEYKTQCRKRGVSSVEYVPYGLLLPHEEWAMRNHCGQSFEVLKSRGGLDYNEMLVIIEDRKWQKVPYIVARQKVLMYVWEYLDSRRDLSPYWEQYKTKLDVIMNGTLD